MPNDDQTAMFMKYLLHRPAKRLAIMPIVYAHILAFALYPAYSAAQTNRGLVEITTNEALPDARYIEIIESLGAAGFLIERINHTWLNRIRIVAVNDRIRREIVISQSTGQVLRDVAYPR
ncbi:MAG: hypothetical protein WD046_11960 [Paracoccaceae bacterium]